MLHRQAHFKTGIQANPRCWGFFSNHSKTCPKHQALAIKWCTRHMMFKLTKARNRWSSQAHAAQHFAMPHHFCNLSFTSHLIGSGESSQVYIIIQTEVWSRKFLPPENSPPAFRQLYVVFSKWDPWKLSDWTVFGRIALSVPSPMPIFSALSFVLSLSQPTLWRFYEIDTCYHRL